MWLAITEHWVKHWCGVDLLFFLFIEKYALHSRKQRLQINCDGANQTKDHDEKDS